MDKRECGKTGEKLSVVGFGGIVVMNETPQDAARFVGEAIERGVNYFDVAPGYGNAEERLGPALEPYRKDVFLACKTGMLTAPEVTAELKRSLERLRTDHVDLYQFHGVSSMEQARQIVGPGGTLEAFAAARDKGLVRHLGFSAHSEEAALFLLESFPFDSVLFPVNFACWNEGAFGPRLAAKAAQCGAAVLALKALARRPWQEGETPAWPKCWYKPLDTLPEVRRALAFTLSHAVAAVSPSHFELFQLACDAADSLADTPSAGTLAAIPDSAPIFSSAL